VQPNFSEAKGINKCGVKNEKNGQEDKTLPSYPNFLAPCANIKHIILLA
jgi:hypothetical protein